MYEMVADRILRVYKAAAVKNLKVSAQWLFKEPYRSLNPTPRVET